nr:ATP-binding protein [Phaeovibrio sulfidiphilus]
MNALYREGPQITLDCGNDAVFIGDEDDLMEMLGNLLDNACKWAAGQVRLSARATRPDGLVLTVEDDGPGLAGDEAESARQRGARLDDTVAGHGLGLDIVQDLASLYGGTLTLDRSFLLGGLRAELRFPAMVPPPARPA